MNSPLAVGDLVELTSMPEQVARDRDKSPETYELFRIAVGRRYVIRGFNEYRMAEIWLNDDASEDTCGINHSLWVELEHLRKFDRTE